jgi:alkyl hydroperoxide reductase subunit AhpC
LRRQYDALRAAGGEVLAICFDAPERAARYAREQALPFPLLVDEERRVYRAYGLEQGALWRMLMPRVVVGALRLMESGRQLQRPHEDPLQLGGDFVVDPAGLLAVAHPCKDPTDRPIAAELLNAVRGTQSSVVSDQ